MGRKSYARRLRRKRAAEGLAGIKPRHTADGDIPVLLKRRGQFVVVVPGPRDRRRDLFIYHRNTLVITGLTMMAQAQGWRWP